MILTDEERGRFATWLEQDAFSECIEENDEALERYGSDKDVAQNKRWQEMLDRINGATA